MFKIKIEFFVLFPQKFEKEKLKDKEKNIQLRTFCAAVYSSLRARKIEKWTERKKDRETETGTDRDRERKR